MLDYKMTIEELSRKSSRAALITVQSLFFAVACAFVVFGIVAVSMNGTQALPGCGILATPTVAFLAIGIGLIRRRKLALTVAKFILIVALVIFGFDLLFLLFFLVVAREFLFFEGGSGFKWLITLLIVTPVLFWQVCGLRRDEVKQEFMSGTSVQTSDGANTALGAPRSSP